MRPARLPSCALLALVLAVALAGAAAPAAAVISMSRGQQFLSISHDECLSRARAALQAAGYTSWGEAGNGPWGNKGDHGAIILCEPTTGNREVIDIVVATANTGNGDVPGAERVQLQGLMEGGGTAQAGSQCPGNATGMRGTGNVLRCWCSADATRGGSVWGSDVYTDDSVICRAAVHAGVIGPSGGTVTLRMLPGMQSYTGSERNGVTSSGYGAWSSSYRFE
jgi:hypothetical protein